MILFPLLLLCLCASSQTFVSGEAGTRLGLNAGYDYHNLIFKGGALLSYTRTEKKSYVAYAAIGYKIGGDINITPYIGIAHYHHTDFEKWYEGICDPIIENKTTLLYSIEVGKNFTAPCNVDYRLYLFGVKSEDIYYGAGLRIFIK